MVIIDADVIIELLRKNPLAKSFIINEVGNANIILSCITVAEIQQGANSKEINQKHFKHIPNLILMKHDIIPLRGKTVLS